MRQTTDSHNMGLILPCVDFTLLLIVILFGTAGLGWLSTCPNFQEGTDEHRQASKKKMAEQIATLTLTYDQLNTPWIEKQKGLQDLRQEFRMAENALTNIELLRHDCDEVTRELERLSQQRASLEQALKKIKAQLAGLEERRTNLSKERKELKQQLAQLEQQLQSLLQRQTDLEKEKQRVEQLKQQLKDAQRELTDTSQKNKNLQDKIAVKSRPVVPKPFVVETTPRFQVDNDREPLLVLISEHTVTPVQEPYYSITKTEAGEHRKLLRLGDNITQSLAAGSDFGQFLDGVNNQTQYVFLWVDSVSFEALRTIRAELRRRHIKCGWTPSVAVNFLISNSGLEPGWD